MLRCRESTWPSCAPHDRAAGDANVMCATWVRIRTHGSSAATLGIQPSRYGDSLQHLIRRGCRWLMECRGAQAGAGADASVGVAVCVRSNMSVYSTALMERLGFTHESIAVSTITELLPCPAAAAGAGGFIAQRGHSCVCKWGRPDFGQGRAPQGMPHVRWQFPAF